MTLDKLMRALRYSNMDRRFVSERNFVNGVGNLFEVSETKNGYDIVPEATGFGITERVVPRPAGLQEYQEVFRTEDGDYIARDGALLYLVKKFLWLLPYRATEGGHFVAKDEDGKLHTGCGADVPRYYGRDYANTIPFDPRDIAEKLSEAD